MNKKVLKSRLNRIISITLIIILTYIISGFHKSLAESVKTMKIVIDPGHGGYETGAVNYNDGIIEKDITLKTSRYLKEYFEDYYGVQVIMTHNGLNNDQEMSVLDRGMCARNNNADLLLCLHFNSGGSISSNWHGAEVYVTNNKSCYKYNQESTEIGNLILNNLSKLGIYNRGVKTRLCNDVGPKWEYSDGTKADYYGIIRYAMKGNSEDRGPDITKGTGITSILIEHCFINGTDVQFINTDAKLKQLAEADGKAIVEHYGLKLKKDVVSEIILSKTNINILVGEKTKIDVSINPNTAINKKVIWKSSNEKVAKVDKDGNVIGIGNGKAEITAIADGNDKVQAKLNVTVTEASINIENGDKWNILKGNTLKLYTDTLVKNAKITYKSSDEKIATVTSDGIVKGIKEGTVKITATLENYSKQDTIELNVNTLEDNEKITIEKYNENNDIISNIEEKTNIDNFIKNIKLSNLKAKIRNDDKIKFVGSGVVLDIYSGNKVIQSYLCKVNGDCNGDGLILANDYLMIKDYIMEEGTARLHGIYYEAADVTGDKKALANDYLKIKDHIMYGVKI